MFFRLILTAFFLEIISAIYGGQFFLIGISLFLMVCTGLFLTGFILYKKLVLS